MIPSPVANRLGAVPLPFFIATVAILNAVLPSAAELGSGLRFESLLLTSVLYTVFISVTSFLVAYISLKSYVQNGSMVLILLGSAALAWGYASLIGAWAYNFTTGPNVGITVVNTGALCASVFHTASGSLTFKGSAPRRGQGFRKILSTLAYTGIILFTTVLTAASMAGLVPLFFVPGAGQTALRMAVLGTAIGLFAVSSVLFARVYFASKSRILYWYFLALGMTSVGLAAVFFGRAPGDPISWIGRAAQFLGGVYFLKAVMATFRDAHSAGGQEPV